MGASERLGVLYRQLFWRGVAPKPLLYSYCIAADHQNFMTLTGELS